MAEQRGFFEAAGFARRKMLAYPVQLLALPLLFGIVLWATYSAVLWLDLVTRVARQAESVIGFSRYLTPFGIVEAVLSIVCWAAILLLVGAARSFALREAEGRTPELVEELRLVFVEQPPVMIGAVLTSLLLFVVGNVLAELLDLVAQAMGSSSVSLRSGAWIGTAFLRGILLVPFFGLVVAASERPSWDESLAAARRQVSARWLVLLVLGWTVGVLLIASGLFGAVTAMIAAIVFGDSARTASGSGATFLLPVLTGHLFDPFVFVFAGLCLERLVGEPVRGEGGESGAA